MPVFTIQAPDGKTLTLEAPEGATQEQVIAAAVELYKPQYGVGETIARGLERGVTSTIRGAAQLLGAPSATVPTEEQDAISQMQGTPLGEQISSLATPGQIQQTDLQREAEFRMMAQQRPVAAYGAQIAGNLLDPINLVPLGGVRTLAQGARNIAIAGGAMGALEPVYEGDSRLMNIAGGAVVGGVLGGTIGGLISKYGREAVEQAGKELKDNRAVLLGGTGRITQDNVPLSPIAQELAEVAAPKNMELQDSIVPLLQQLEDSELATKLTNEIAGGDYRALFTDAPFRLTDIPASRFTAAFSADNPLREQNLAAYLKAGYKAEDPEQLLTRIVSANKGAIATELDTTPINIPADSAVNFLLNRKVQEIGGRDLINAYIPALQRGVDMINSIDELFLNGRAAGMTDAEIAAVFKKDFDEVKPILFSAIGNVSNIGRALAAAKAQKKVMGSTEEILKGLAKQGGQDLKDIYALRDAISTIKAAPATDFDKNKAIGKLITNTVKEPGWNDKFGEFVVNAFISGLATPAVNALSGIAKIGLVGMERAIQAVDPRSQVKIKEVLPSFRGLMDGVLESAFFAKEGFLRGSPLDAAMPEFRGAIGTQAGATKFEKYLGEVVRVPSRVSVGTDEFFKAIFRRMEYNAQAYRIASSGKYGDTETVYNTLRNIDTKDLNWRDNVLKAPDLAALPNATRAQLIDDVREFAKKATFQADLGKFGNRILAFRANHPEFAPVIPFIKTPINIMKDALSYTPLAVFAKNTPADVKTARVAIGMGITGALALQVAQEKVTGSYPKEADKRNAMIAAGIPEYSLKIGDTWYSYARIEPLATVMGTAVDGINAVNRYLADPKYDTKAAEKARNKLVVDVVGGITTNIASKTFLEGISGVLQAMHNPERYGGSFINSFAGLLVPSFIAAPARSADPYARVVTSFGEAVQNRVPDFGLGLPIPSRQELPIQSKLFGGARENPSYGLAAYTGLQTSPAARTVVQEEVARTKVDYDLPDKSLRGVELDGADQAKYQDLSSRYADMILPGIIASPGYQNAPDTLKKVILEKGLSKARQAATNLLLGEKLKDPEFRTQFIRARLEKKGLEMEE
jgi:hypothetical protein